MDQAMLPLSTAIEQEVATIQAEADSVTQKGQVEYAQVNKELAELAELVHAFQVSQRPALLVLHEIAAKYNLLSAEPHFPAAAWR